MLAPLVAGSAEGGTALLVGSRRLIQIRFEVALNDGFGFFHQRVRLGARFALREEQQRGDRLDGDGREQLAARNGEMLGETTEDHLRAVGELLVERLTGVEEATRVENVGPDRAERDARAMQAGERVDR